MWNLAAMTLSFQKHSTSSVTLLIIWQISRFTLPASSLSSYISMRSKPTLEATCVSSWTWLSQWSALPCRISSSTPLLNTASVSLFPHLLCWMHNAWSCLIDSIRASRSNCSTSLHIWSELLAPAGICSTFYSFLVPHLFFSCSFKICLTWLFPLLLSQLWMIQLQISLLLCMCW